MRTSALHFLWAVVLWQATHFSCAAGPAPIRVALLVDAGGSGPGIESVMEQLGSARNIQVTKVKGADIAGGGLKDFDVVIFFTGGSAGEKAKSLGDEGREEIRRFVREGGGYIGICASDFLASSGFDWAFGTLDVRRTVTSLRGWGIENAWNDSTKTGRLVVKRGSVFHENGVILKPTGRSDIPDYDVRAYFRTELAENDSPVSAIINLPTMTTARFGKGPVMIVGPHSEQKEWIMELVVRSVGGSN